MKKWFCLLLCAAMLTGTALAQTTHLAYLYGYPDGTIKPNEAVTREMLAEVLLRLTGYEPQTDAFFDVPPTRWSYRAVCMVTELGIMHSERGYFRPTDPISAEDLARAVSCVWGAELETDLDEITRAELAHILNRILNRQPQSLDDLMLGMPGFSDNQDTNAWYYLDLQEASCAHTYEPTPNGERWTGLG